MSVDLDVKRATIEKVVKLGFIGLVCAVVGPYAWLALEGIIAIGAFIGTAAVAWAVAPMLATMIANWRIKLLVDEAERNPIETLQNDLIESQTEYDTQDTAIEAFETEYGTVSDLVEDLKKTDPEDVASYIAIRDEMANSLEVLRGEQSSFKAVILEMKKAVDKARRIYKVANAINKALEKSATAQQAVFREIKQQVAFDTVRGNMNKARARLRSAVERRRTTPMAFKSQLSLPPATAGSGVDVIDLGNVPVKVPVNRKVS